MDHLDVIFKKGSAEIFPKHKFVNNWLFSINEEEEASLAHFIAAVGEKNGLTNSDIAKIFPFILRMLKSKSVWSD
jgi:hypothetical protein